MAIIIIFRRVILTSDIKLTVKALVAQDRQYVYHAAMMDPHTGAELDLEQIWQMVDELINAHGDWLPEFLSKAI